ncbi:7928_t:CDS:2 [Paraglomus occultum]|uniref:7928_t:CDS:1 n=1 Tax=Paraglomus occultum TaxID=144539 RepID=A0A9N8ZQN4_9GLOM|nr:7928_t:CDS:2 [Paraglomus occultum]
MSVFQPRSLRRKRNAGHLTLNASPVVPKADDVDTTLAKGLTDLELGKEFRLDLRSEDLILLRELGSGNGGTVSQVKHVTTQTIMAKKIIHIEAKPQVRKQILRELTILHECNSKYIVSFYGAFVTEEDRDIAICMEYMDVGSLDAIYKKTGPIPLPILGKITLAVLEGLNYLYGSHKIIHRDVKPSNILVNSKGQIKICDFGVSGQVINSIADTFPERIQGATYTVRSDVWSVGITLIELAIGRFPFPPDGSKLTVLELLQHIVNEAPPTLPPGEFPDDFDDLTKKCLSKDVSQRPNLQELLKHPYVVEAQKSNVDVEAWTRNVRRKSTAAN